MFEQSLVESTHGVGTRKPAALLASMATQGAIILAVAVIPLLRYQILPALQLSATLAVPALPVAPPAPAPLRVVRLNAIADNAPVLLPPPRFLSRQPAPAATAAPVVLPPGTGGFGAAPNFTGTILAPAPPPVRILDAPAPPPPSRIAVGGAVQQARCLACAPPVYPAFARQAHLEGTVELHALIGADGTVQQLTAVAGNAVLAAAAIRAVRAWRYQPLLLNGQAQAVDTMITVRFELGGS